MPPEFQLPSIYPSEMKTYVHIKNPYDNVYSTFICDYQKLETVQITCSWITDNQTLAHAYNGILLSNKMEHILHTYSQIEESQLHDVN